MPLVLYGILEISKLIGLALQQGSPSIRKEVLPSGKKKLVLSSRKSQLCATT